MKKSHVSVLMLIILALVVAGCGGSKKESSETGGASASAAPQVEKLKVGVMAGEEEAIWRVAVEVAKKDGLDIELVTFNDYVQPNLSLDDGQLDANAFQHIPYLDEFNAQHNTKIVKLANTINFPIGVYSHKIKDLSELKEGDVLGLPNDPTNGARSLILFESAGLIKLKEGVGITATVRDIVENPKKLEFKELDAAFIPKALDDLTAAVINTTFALQHNLVPSKDAIYRESNDSPWVNIIAVREGEENKPVFQKLVKAYQSEEVKKYVNDNFADSMVVGW